jgi:2-iminobutanoate/2-iminopropanoate deaminase
VDKQAIFPLNYVPSKAPVTPAIRFHHLLFVSGQVPRDPEGKTPEGIKAQAELTLRNLRNVVQAAGGDLSHVVRCTCYLANMDDFTAFNEVYRTFFSEPYPTRSAVQVARLPGPAFLIEIDAIAILAE